MAFREADNNTDVPQLFLAARSIAAWADLCLPVTSGPACQHKLAELRRPRLPTASCARLSTTCFQELTGRPRSAP